MLSWQDFELLVDLIFSASGWRRVGVVGGSQETVDIELVLPSTGDRAFVQIKSATTQNELDDYLRRFEKRDEGRMFFRLSHGYRYARGERQDGKCHRRGSLGVDGTGGGAH